MNNILSYSCWGVPLTDYWRRVLTMTFKPPTSYIRFLERVNGGERDDDPTLFFEISTGWSNRFFEKNRRFPLDKHLTIGQAYPKLVQLDLAANRVLLTELTPKSPRFETICRNIDEYFEEILPSTVQYDIPLDGSDLYLAASSDPEILAEAIGSGRTFEPELNGPSEFVKFCLDRRDWIFLRAAKDLGVKMAGAVRYVIESSDKGWEHLSELSNLGVDLRKPDIGCIETPIDHATRLEKPALVGFLKVLTK